MCLLSGVVALAVNWSIKPASTSKVRRKGIMMRVCGLANSKGMPFDSQGLPLEQWRDRMVNADQV